MFINFYQILVEILSLTKGIKKIFKVLILFFLTIVSFFEILTIGSLIPLMEVLINPNEYISNSNYFFIKKIIPLADESDLRKIILIVFFSSYNFFLFV